jgi:hypothetical protein
MRKIALGLVLCLGVFAVWQGWQAPQEGADAKGLMNPVSDYLFAKNVAGTWLMYQGGDSYDLWTLGADGTIVMNGTGKYGSALGPNLLSGSNGCWKRVGEREIAASVLVFSIDSNDWGQGPAPGPFFEVWGKTFGTIQFNEDFTEAVAEGNVELFRADQDGDGDVDADDPNPLDDDAVPYLQLGGLGASLRRVPVWE